MTNPLQASLDEGTDCYADTNTKIVARNGFARGAQAVLAQVRAGADLRDLSVALTEIMLQTSKLFDAEDAA